MHKLLRILFLVAGIVVCHLSYSQSYKAMKDTTAFKTALEGVAKKTNTIKSDFVQEKNLSVLSEKIVSKGQFLFKKNNLLRWEYNDPFQYTIVLNGNNVLIKDGKKVSKYDVQSNKMFKEINDMMVGMVQGKLLNNKTFKVRYLEDAKFYIIESVPLEKNKKEFLKEVFLYFDKKDFQVSRINITEPSGDNTEISFMNRQVNTAIGNESFIIK